MTNATEMSLDVLAAIQRRDMVYRAILRMVESGTTNSPKYRYYVERMNHYNAIIERGSN